MKMMDMEDTRYYLIVFKIMNKKNTTESFHYTTERPIVTEEDYDSLLDFIAERDDVYKQFIIILNIQELRP